MVVTGAFVVTVGFLVVVVGALVVIDDVGADGVAFVAVDVVVAV